MSRCGFAVGWFSSGRLLVLGFGDCGFGCFKFGVCVGYLLVGFGWLWFWVVALCVLLILWLLSGC